VWDARSGKACFGPLKHGDRVATAQFSPDGKRIVTASDDRTARVWDAESGQPQTGPIRHGFLVVSAQFSPDGKQIVTVDMNGKTRVWDSQNGQPLTESLELHATSAQFSPDGKQVVTASEDGNSARVWDIAPLNTAGPDWMLQMAEAISGKVLNKRNVLEETKLDRVETLEQIRQKLNAEPSDDDWVVWGRWFLADPSTRTISPFSKITVPEYIEGRIKEHTTESLDEAERLAAGNPGLLQQISQARNTLEQTK
jgi:dipeptidyl aminopeptidase/acylaminoacyl peptidase